MGSIYGLHMLCESKHRDPAKQGMIRRMKHVDRRR